MGIVQKDLMTKGPGLAALKKQLLLNTLSSQSDVEMCAFLDLGTMK